MELTFLYAFLLDFIKRFALWVAQKQCSNLSNLLDSDLEGLQERVKVELRKQSLWYSGFEKLPSDSPSIRAPGGE